MLPQLNAAFYVQLTCFEADPVQLDLVSGVVRVRLDGFLVEDERSVVVLNRLRFLALIEIGLSFRAAHSEQPETNA